MVEARIYERLEKEIIADLTTELQSDVDFSEDVLAVKVRSAIREVIHKRCYENSTLDDEGIENDLYSFYSSILNIARYDYNQLGAEGQQAHTENSITRSWVSRSGLFKGIIPFAKII